MPGVQPDMMMIATRRKKDSTVSIILHHIKSKNIPIKFQSFFQVRYFQMHMANSCLFRDLIFHNQKIKNYLAVSKGCLWYKFHTIHSINTIWSFLKMNLDFLNHRG